MSDPHLDLLQARPSDASVDPDRSVAAASGARATDDSMGGVRGGDYRAELDGVRAIAVGLVILFHLGTTWMPGGFIGVDVFFVLSGYLITGVLLKDVREHGRVRFGRFYARRARRLLPAAAFTLTAVIVAARYLLPLGDRWSLWQDAKAAALYAANWHLIWDSREYFAQGSIPGPIEHWWSLAVEEQFYFVWPLVLMSLAWVASRRSSRMRALLPVAIGVLLAASVLLSFAFTTPNGYFRYYATFTRAYHLLAGALVAVLVAKRRTTSVASPRARAVGATLAAASVTSLVVLAVMIDGADGYPGRAGLAVTAASTALIVALAAFPAGALHRVLGARPLAAMGRLSYSLYLWHWPVIVFAPLLAKRAKVPGGDDPVVLVVLTFVCAGASYLLVEKPIRFRVWPKAPAFAVIASGLAASVAIAGASGSVLVPSANDDEPAAVQAAAPGKPGARPAKIAVSVAAIVAASRDIASSQPCPYWDAEWPADPAKSEPCVVRRGPGPTFAIAGDSHAEMWLPAVRVLADRYDATLVLGTRTACGFPQVLTAVTDKQGRVGRKMRCIAWRDRYYQKIVDQYRPDVVFLGTRSHTVSVWDRDELVRPNLAEHHRLWREGAARTIGRFSSAGAQVVAFASLPTPLFDVPDCLSKHASDAAECDYPADADWPVGVYNQILSSLEAVDERLHVLSMLDVVCPNGTCPAVIGGTITHRDDDHISATFSRGLADEIDLRLAKAGIRL